MNIGKNIRDTLWTSVFDNINNNSLYHLTYVSPLKSLTNSIHTNLYHALNNTIKLYIHNQLIQITNVHR